jgi:hypothetical protein
LEAFDFMSSLFLSVYPNSFREFDDSVFFMANTDDGDKLVVSGSEMAQFDGAETDIQGMLYKLCPLTVENSKRIRKLFDFTNPVRHKGRDITIGLGDRLGIASPGHIRLLRDLDVFPVLAQQSMRELNLTGRTYDDVLAAAVWAVFREGYTNGYGADGDHLKTHEEVKYALDCGFTMITLDCSEHIDNDLINKPQSEIDKLYSELPADIITELESAYLKKAIPIDENMSINFCRDDFRRTVLIYLPAIRHAISIYNELLKGVDVDFEVSIDETLTTTSPEQHYFVANELIKQGVEIVSLAPRFVGEFQKGIDYRGDVTEFESDFLSHAKIAEKMGYTLSVHSGSDKFSIFPIVGRLTKGKYHLKTAGTNWLEAVRVIAVEDTDLYREIHAFSLENLSEARKYYHVIADTSNIPDIDLLFDDQLVDYLDIDDSRQVLHITYGLILMAKSDDGSWLFRDRIFDVLSEFESEYIMVLEKHIGRHLTDLGIIN